MAIQPFAMQVETANVMLPSEAMAGAERLKGLRQQNAMTDMEMADKQNLDRAYRENHGDLNAMMMNPNMGFEAGMKIAGMQADMATASAKADKERLESTGKKLEIGSQILQGSSPERWEQTKQEWIDAGLDPRALPDQYDENVIKTRINQGVSAKDKLAAEFRDKGYTLDLMQFNESRRHNSVQEGIGWANAQNRGGGDDSAKNWDVDIKSGVRINRATGEVQSLTQNGTTYTPPNPASTKPLPPAALKMQQEALDAIGTAGTINADLSSITGLIDSGKLDFGPVSNIKNKAKNAAGFSDEQSRNFATFESTLEKLRNDSLRLNKGVQTDGDAQRAWNELLQNINDPAVVKQRLGEIQAINERGAALQQMNVDQIRANYGAEPLDTSGRMNQPAAIGAQNSADDHSSLWN